MKKTSLVILSLAFATFVPGQIMASVAPGDYGKGYGFAHDPQMQDFDTWFGQFGSEGDIKSFRDPSGGNIFHELFDRLVMYGDADGKIAQKITDLIFRFPELIVTPDNHGRFATESAYELLPLSIYGALGRQFNVFLYNPAPDLQKEKFVRDVAPALLASIYRGMMMGDEYVLAGQAASKKDTAKAAQAKQDLAVIKASQDAYDAFVLNGSRGLLRVKPKGIGVPLFMVPVDYQRKGFIETLFRNESSSGITGFTNSLFKLAIDTKALKFIDLANNGYSGLYAAFQKGGGYFDRFFEAIKSDPDYNDPIFLDAVVWAMTEVGVSAIVRTPLVSKGQFDQLMAAYPGLAQRIIGFPGVFRCEGYFEEDLRNEHAKRLLSTPKDTFPFQEAVNLFAAEGMFTLPPELSDGKVQEFTDFFRITSLASGHTDVNSGFWEYLYSNPYFGHTKESSAVRAFLIGLDMSMHKVDLSTFDPSNPPKFEIFGKGVMSSLIQKDDVFTGQAPAGLSKAVRAIQLMNDANQFAERRDIRIGVREETGGIISPLIQYVMNDEVLDILSGQSSYGLNLKRKASRDEFLIAMNALGGGNVWAVKTKMLVEIYPSDTSPADRARIKRHRENVLLCAEWMDWERNYSDGSEAQRIRLMASASSLALSPDEIKDRLYRMEDRFMVPGFFIRDRTALDAELSRD